MNNEPTTVNVWAPELFRDDWQIFFDAYRQKVYGAMKTRDFKSFTDVTREVSFPAGHKHGTAIKVPYGILAGLLKTSQAATINK